MPGRPRDYVKKITYCTQGIPLWTRDTNYLLNYFLSLSLTLLGSYPQSVSRIIYIFNSFSIWIYTFITCALIKHPKCPERRRDRKREKASHICGCLASVDQKSHGPGPLYPEGQVCSGPNLRCSVPAWTCPGGTAGAGAILDGEILGIFVVICIWTQQFQGES